MDDPEEPWKKAPRIPRAAMASLWLALALSLGIWCAFIALLWVVW